MQPVSLVQSHVGQGQRDELAAAAGAGEPHQQHRDVPPRTHPAGHAAAVCSMEDIRMRMSSSNSGDRRTGGVDRMRRIPDNARRTTSDRPGASSPAAVWNWLIEDTHRVNDAGAYRHRPTPVVSAAACVT